MLHTAYTGFCVTAFFVYTVISTSTPGVQILSRLPDTSGWKCDPPHGPRYWVFHGKLAAFRRFVYQNYINLVAYYSQQRGGLSTKL